MAAAAEAMFDAGFDHDATAWLALLQPAPASSDPAELKLWIEGEPWHPGAFGINPGWAPDRQELLMIRAELEQDRATAPSGTAGYSFNVYPAEAADRADRAFTWLARACDKAQIVLSSEAALDPALRQTLDDMVRDPWRSEQKCAALAAPIQRAIMAAYLRAHPEEKGEIDAKKAISRAVRDIKSVAPDALMSSPFAELAGIVLSAVANGSVDKATSAPSEPPHKAALRLAMTEMGLSLDAFEVTAELENAIRQALALSQLYLEDLEQSCGPEPEETSDYRGMLSPACRIAPHDVLCRALVIATAWKTELPVAALAEAVLEMRMAQAWRMIKEGEVFPPSFCDLFLAEPQLALEDLLDDARKFAKNDLESTPSLDF